MSIANLWAVVYLVLVIVPGALWWRPTVPDAYLYDAARLAGLLGFSVIVLQPILAARFKWIERGVGLDRLMHWHRLTGLLGTLLVTAHLTFFLIYYGQFGTASALSFITPALNYQTLGLSAFVLVWLTVLFALLRKRLHLPYHWWRRLHLVGYVIVLLAFLHSWFISSDIATYPGLRYYFSALFGVMLYTIIYRYGIHAAQLRRHPYHIERIREIVPGVRHITFGGGPAKPMHHEPGQCLFVKFFADGVTGEWHPFTISSSPTDPALTLSIKASGDWTSTLGNLKVGDRALLDGPYGRFSYTRLPKHERSLVYIAGGIGITPLRSMLRACAATTPQRPQYLFYANKAEADIAFRSELEALTQKQGYQPVVHILSRPDKPWSGAQGHVNAALIKKYLPDAQQYDYFICGPKPMMAAVKKELRSLGVPKQHMQSEEFALV